MNVEIHTASVRHTYTHVCTSIPINKYTNEPQYLTLMWYTVFGCMPVLRHNMLAK